MKRVLFLLSPLLLALATSAQSTENGPVPQAATRDFASRYPATPPKKWKQDKEGQYVAQFKLNHDPAESIYNERGVWRKTIIHYRSSAKLPLAIKSSLHNSDYSSCRFDQMQETDSAEKKLFYVTATYLNLHEEGPGDSFAYRLTISPEGQILESKLID